MGSHEFYNGVDLGNFASSVYVTPATDKDKDKLSASKKLKELHPENVLQEMTKEEKKSGKKAKQEEDKMMLTVEDHKCQTENRTRDDDETDIRNQRDKKSAVRKRKQKKDDNGMSNRNVKASSKEKEMMTLDSSKEAKVPKEGFEVLEKKLREFDFYHGFMPREDLSFVLNNKGDYILRVSEIAESENKVKREIILSLIPVGGKEEKDDCKTPRNVIIKRHGKKFFIEASRPFSTVNSLIEYYKKNTGVCNSIVFQLKNPQMLQPWEFMHSNVTIGKVLGEGAFGVVCSGTLKLKDGSTVEVAIKMTKTSTFLSKAKIKEMMNEARFIRNFNHKNVVKMYGVAHDEQPLYILLELIKGGSLKDHLNKNKGNLTMVDKLKFCLGAAKGIEYLHSMKCIHRDIAARNFLLSENVVKITDFGLSRTGPSYKLRTSSKLPTKWLSPEVLTTLSFSYASDVYSYGVTCYEIFAEGAEPYEGMTNAMVKADLSAGKFLQLPANCPENVKKFLSSNVFVEVSKRTTMVEVVAELEKATSAAESAPTTPSTPSTPSTPVTVTPSREPDHKSGHKLFHKFRKR